MKQRQLLWEMLTGIALTIALEQLDAESRQQGIERRQLKRQQNEVLQPLRELIAAADERIRELKQQRQNTIPSTAAQMHAAYSLTNFSGQSLSLQQLMPSVARYPLEQEIVAPLNYCTMQQHIISNPWQWQSFGGEHLQQIKTKVQGEFYGACAERCQPIMGFLLSGFRPNPPTPFPTREGGEISLPIIYEDEWLIAVNKPAGLLSVPGRYRESQDSVLSRLRHLLPDGMALTTVHRLDQETSGILVLARDRLTHRHLSRQFQQRQVHKVYEAILAGAVTTDKGVIELPLWGDPQNRPYQQVDWQHGKPSFTHFRVMGKEGNYTRVEFMPLTGRTHQIRVHAADVQGLGITILGDRLYGCRAVANRLHLHARELRFQHPQLGKILYLQAKTPF